ncbi:MAG TPA: tetratricopeptide repeat protein [Thermoanaerobaculia bacterium]
MRSTHHRPRPTAVRGGALTLLAALAALAVTGAGCAGNPYTVMGPEQVAKAARSHGVDPASIVIPYQLTDEMRAWVHKEAPTTVPFEKRLSLLLNGLLSPSLLKIEYEPRHTGTAREVFETRHANCLAFTSLFVGMAREVGVPVFYLDVEDVQKYEKDGDLVVVSGHVSAGYGDGKDLRIYDFSAAPSPGYRQVRPINDLTAIALFHSNRGAELLRVGRDAEALPWLRTAVALDPELARAWTNYGVAQRRSGDNTGAEASYRKALELDPGMASAYQNLASLLRLRGKNQEADQLLYLSVRSDGRNPFGYLALGDLSLSQGRFDEARRFYRKAMRRYQHHAEPYAAMGQVSLAEGDTASALSWLRKALALDQENPRVKHLKVLLVGSA